MADPKKPLAGRLALVTGASRGIGAETAVALAGAGAHVILTARTEGGLTETEQRIFEKGGKATIAPLDLMDGDAIDQLGGAVSARWGTLDVLVLNAGQLGSLSPVAHIDPKEWQQVVGVNLTANARLIRSFDPLLRSSKAGRLVALTSSVAAAGMNRAYWGAYAATKVALEMLVQTYGEECRNVSNVRVAIVDPAATRTAMRAKAFPGEDPDSLKTPDYVAHAVTKLLVEDFESGRRLVLPKLG